MIIRFTRTITLSSCNESRNFCFNDRCYGRVEYFKTSTIMTSEFNEVVNCVAEFYRSETAKVETVEPEQHVEDNNLLDTLKVVGGMVMVNILTTLATLGIVWYNL